MVKYWLLVVFDSTDANSEYVQLGSVHSEEVENRNRSLTGRFEAELSQTRQSSSSLSVKMELIRHGSKRMDSEHLLHDTEQLCKPNSRFV